MPPSNRASSGASRPLMRHQQFQTTHWSAVLSVAGDGTAARAALAYLCAAYWYPLYAFVRRSGCRPEDAEDLTQGFFEHLLDKRQLERVQRGKGRFRSFLLGSLKHFLAHQRERRGAQKRGGHALAVPLDALLAENRYSDEPADTLSPDRLFDRRWAFTVLERALAQVQREFSAPGKEAFFEALRPALTSERTAGGYAQIAARFAMSEEAVKVTVHRLRQRYRAALRSEIAETVATSAEVDAELQHLLEALSG